MSNTHRFLIFLMIAFSSACLASALICVLGEDSKSKLGEELVLKIEDFKTKNGRYPEIVEFNEWLDERHGNYFGYSPRSYSSYELGYQSFALGESVTYDTKLKCWWPGSPIDVIYMKSKYRCKREHN
jgi:hypothetical protein